MDKLAISWQNLAQVGLQLKFSFKLRPFNMQLTSNFVQVRLYLKYAFGIRTLFCTILRPKMDF